MRSQTVVLSASLSAVRIDCDYAQPNATTHKKTRKSLMQLERKSPLLRNDARQRAMYWWSRRESNPRPQIFHRQFYMLSRLIWF